MISSAQLDASCSHRGGGPTDAALSNQKVCPFWLADVVHAADESRWVASETRGESD